MGRQVYAEGQRHRPPADNSPFFKRRHTHVSWRLTAGLDHAAALEVLHQRRSSVGPWPRCRVGADGSIALNINSRNKSARFRGRLDQVPDPRGGGGDALVVSGTVRELLSVLVGPMILAFVALLMFAVFVLGAVNFSLPPLIIGLVATPLTGAMAVAFSRGRGQSYASDTQRFYSDLHTLLSPLHPEPLDNTPDLTRA